MPLDTLGWLFVAGALAHNLEEALGLPGWSTRAGRWHRPVGRFEFAFAVAALSAALVACAGLAFASGSGGVWPHVFCGYVVAMVANVALPHLLATAMLRTYMPGTATALAFNLPLGIAFLWRALDSAWVSGRTLAWVGPMVALGLLAGIKPLFWLGRWLRGAAGSSSQR